MFDSFKGSGNTDCGSTMLQEQQAALRVQDALGHLFNKEKEEDTSELKNKQWRVCWKCLCSLEQVQ